MAKITTKIGLFLVLVILTSTVYYMIPEKVRIDMTPSRTFYAVWENNHWVTAATEYVHLYDGTKKMRAKSRELNNWTDNQFAYQQRISIWKDNITTLQTYVFNRSTPEVEQTPIHNKFECFNCEGKIVHYEIRDILYSGLTKRIKSPFSFGHNFKIEWEEGAYYSKVFQQKVANDKIIIRYSPKSSYEEYHVRLFDPPKKHCVVRENIIYCDWEFGNLTVNPEKATSKLNNFDYEVKFCNKQKVSGYAFVGFRFTQKLRRHNSYEFGNWSSSCPTYGWVKNNYTCEFDLSILSPNRARCQKSVNKTTVVLFEHKFSKRDIASKTIWWNEWRMKGSKPCHVPWKNINQGVRKREVKGKDLYHNTQGLPLSPGECEKIKFSITPEDLKGKFDVVFSIEDTDDWSCILSNTCKTLGVNDPFWSGNAIINTIFYDHFDTGTFPDNGWTNIVAGFNEASSRITPTGTSKCAYQTNFSNISYTDDHWQLDWKGKSAGAGANDYSRLLIGNEVSDCSPTNSIQFRFDCGDTNKQILDCVGTCNCTTTEAACTGDSGDHLNTIIFNATTGRFSWYRDGVYKNSAIINGCNMSEYYLIHFGRNTGTNADYYNLSIISFPSDSVAPKIYIEAPANQTNTTDNTPTITFNCTDETSSTCDCELLFNGTGYGTNSSVVNATSTNLTANATVSDGNPYFWISCSDGTNTNTSANYTMRIDSTNPEINLSSPSNASYHSPTNMTFSYNATDSDVGIDNCSLYLNSSLNLTNSSVVKIINNFSVELTTQANYTWLVGCCDTLGNCDNSSTRWFYILDELFSWSIYSGVIADVFAVNYSVLNWSTIINTSGNFSWNFTQSNISTYNVTEYVFRINNSLVPNVSVRLEQNQSLEWYDWKCAGINVTDSATHLFYLVPGIRDVNCTIDLKNISQTYVNWSVTTDRAFWDFTYTFSGVSI